MSAREEILAAVREATADVRDRADEPVPRGYRTRPAPTGADLVDLFVERVADYRATVTRCSPEQVTDTLREALGGATGVLTAPGLSYDIPGDVPGDVVDDTGQTALELDQVDAVVTEASVGIATTGTLVLEHATGQGRRALSLVPDHHLCIIRSDQVVPGVPDAVAALDPHRPQTWISGPSATSDIELDRVEGVHGPRNLHVVVVEVG